MSQRTGRPRDPNQLVKLIVDIAIGETKDPIKTPDVAKRRGGIRGGRARAIKLAPATRRAIAKKAASARWKKDR